MVVVVVVVVVVVASIVVSVVVGVVVGTVVVVVGSIVVVTVVVVVGATVVDGVVVVIVVCSVVVVGCVVVGCVVVGCVVVGCVVVASVVVVSVVVITVVGTVVVLLTGGTSERLTSWLFSLPTKFQRSCICKSKRETKCQRGQDFSFSKKCRLTPKVWNLTVDERRCYQSCIQVRSSIGDCLPFSVFDQGSVVQRYLFCVNLMIAVENRNLYRSDSDHCDPIGLPTDETDVAVALVAVLCSPQQVREGVFSQHDADASRQVRLRRLPKRANDLLKYFIPWKKAESDILMNVRSQWLQHKASEKVHNTMTAWRSFQVLFQQAAVPAAWHFG